MSMVRPTLAALCLGALPFAAQAHPHVFIDTALRVVVDDTGTFTGIEVRWSYDDFYSLLIFADMGLDPDGDGLLDAGELAQLDGFDLAWIDGYQGDSFASRDGAPVVLGPPQPRGTVIENGKIVTTHFRAANAPAAGLVIRVYDPTLYTAYTLVGQVEVDGPCTSSIEPADLAAAYDRLEKLLFATPEADRTDYYPEVGADFADTVMLSCAS